MQSSIAVENPAQVWSGSTIIVQSRSNVGSTNDNQSATLQQQVSSMNSDLQRLQRDNGALRNLSQQQSGDITSARSDLAASQDAVRGQSQDLESRLSAIQQDLQSSVTKLQDSVKSADDVVNQIRSMLGMPAATFPSSSGS